MSRALRALMAAALFGGAIVHAVQPGWMTRASFDPPRWIRWLGFVLGAAALVAVHRVLRTLGSNVTETVFTKERHAVGLMLGSWFILLATGLALVLIRLVVIPREEQALLARFGEAYASYMRATGRLLPKMRGGASTRAA